MSMMRKNIPTKKDKRLDPESKKSLKLDWD